MRVYLNAMFAVDHKVRLTEAGIAFVEATAEKSKPKPKPPASSTPFVPNEEDETIWLEITNSKDETFLTRCSLATLCERVGPEKAEGCGLHQMRKLNIGETSTFGFTSTDNPNQPFVEFQARRVPALM